MRLADLPATRVVDGRRQRQAPARRRAPLTREQELEQEVAALRSLLVQARDVYRESVGCIVRMVNTPQRDIPVETLRRVRERGRAFLVAAGAQTWDRPTGLEPSPHHTSWR